MRNVYLLLFLISFIPIGGFSLPADCQCPKVSCNDPCKEPSGNLEFYTDKCDGGKRVKSCAKVRCVFKDPLPAQCQAKTKPNKKQKKQAYAANATTGNWVHSDEIKNVQIGVVTFAHGKSWLFRRDKKIKLKVGKKIFVKDTIETSANGKLKIVFKDDNSVNVNSNSKLVLTEYVFGQNDGNNSALLELVYGQIRPKVQRKYKGTSASRFQIKSKVAVAGVRGTDFVVSFQPKKSIEMKVETLQGEVELASLDRKKFVWIPAGNTSKFVANKEDYQALARGEKLDNVRGHLSLMERMSNKYQKSLTALTDFNLNDATAKMAEHRQICSAPKGDLNQCSWTCEGKSVGMSRRCPTEREGVRCVRRRCDANGHWRDEMRLPSSANSSCLGDRVIVAPCDY